jgi:hypothetical protein
MEAELAELAPELAGVGLIEVDATILQQVDVAGGGGEAQFVEAAEPGGHFVFDLGKRPEGSTKSERGLPTCRTFRSKKLR